MNRTRIVRWLRVLLPLVALTMLSTMFLLSRQSDTESSIPYAEVDAKAAAQDGRIVGPEYMGVTNDGVEMSLRAASATPDNGADGGDATDLRLDWKRPDGVTADVVAPKGGTRDGVVSLDGGVVMTTSTGWQVRTQILQAQTDQSVITADQGIEADAPFGQLRADQMRLAPDEDSDAAQKPAILNFSGGVRLIYQP
jgi:lipopolysaccharide export system protein LptC